MFIPTCPAITNNKNPFFRPYQLDSSGHKLRVFATALKLNNCSLNEAFFSFPATVVIVTTADPVRVC